MSAAWTNKPIKLYCFLQTFVLWWHHSPVAQMVSQIHWTCTRKPHNLKFKELKKSISINNSHHIVLHIVKYVWGQNWFDQLLWVVLIKKVLTFQGFTQIAWLCWANVGKWLYCWLIVSLGVLPVCRANVGPTSTCVGRKLDGDELLAQRWASINILLR